MRAHDTGAPKLSFATRLKLTWLGERGISLANVRHHWEKGTMAEFIHEHSTRVKGEDGMTYIVRIYAQERIDGTWEGWLEFRPTDEGKPVLRTEQETSQPNRMAVEYWASGLEPIYLEGAFARSQGRLL